MERVTLRGKPFPCAERGVEGCTGSCAAGACVGSAKCANAKSAEACSATSGCAWDDQACGGTATSTCTLTDYGATPGCEILSGKTECVGTPTACEQLSESNCWFNAGCKSGGHCTGGAQSCQQFEGTCAACSLHSGCKCDGAKTCQGTTTCEGHPLSDCDDINGCTWRECAGEPLPCSQFSELQCPNVPGCHVEGP